MSDRLFSRDISTLPPIAVRQTTSRNLVSAPGAEADLLVAALRATGIEAVVDTETHVATPTLALHDCQPERVEAAIRRWRAAHAERSVLLASPRAACAGVDRAVALVELALERFGAPIYVRKQIVHNEHTVADLASHGAMFVDAIDEIPHGAVVVFSAHGVSPSVRAAAAARELVTVDATCPLVAKVHSEARQHVRDGRTVAYIGHSGHEESDGVLGEAPDAIRLVETVEDAERLAVPAPNDVAFLTQTTLASDEVDEIVSVLRRRYPDAHGPRGQDICYATTNRQQAIRALAERVDLILVVGSRTSSNANRLVEVAASVGASAALIEDATELDPALLHDVGRLGITAAASTPEPLVVRLVEALRTLGRVELDEVRVASENISFTLPAAFR